MPGGTARPPTTTPSTAGFLGDDEFVWGPEGWTEEDLGLLAAAPGQRVLEIGAGAGQCARWLERHVGASVVATDLSMGMLRVGAGLSERTGTAPPLLQCDALALPFGDAVFDTVFTAYGVVPFVADSAAVMAEVARVLRPGGRFVFSTTHPIRWAFPDDPSEAGLVARLGLLRPDALRRVGRRGPGDLRRAPSDDG